MESVIKHVQMLSEIGIALSQDKPIDELLNEILEGAMQLTMADGGTFYSVEDGQLLFRVIKNRSMGIDEICTKPGKFIPIPLSDEAGNKNHHAVVAHAYHSQSTINIEDIYHDSRYDFSGAKAFDNQANYKTRSLLTVPLKNHEDDVIAVLQLINAQNDQGEPIAFDFQAQKLTESLASQAAISLTNRSLIRGLEELFDAMIRMLAESIDEKSPYTGGHCRRVPVITMMLAQAASEVQEGPLKDFCMSDKDYKELETAAWLHDCGKVTTPEYVVDKATKLETIFDRIELVKLRLEIMAKNLKIKLLETGDRENYAVELDKLNGYWEFISKVNVGGEFLEDEAIDRIDKIASFAGVESELFPGTRIPLLTENEAYNLSIRKGTLTPEEREVINNHIVMTIKMLESLPFPKHLANVPEYAGGHHEKMDGTGYPRGLTKEQMSVPARIMAIADIFEALSAADRPYKKAKPLSECLKILGFMAKDNHIDPDLFRIFVEQGGYMDYARQYFAPDQIDEVDLCKIPGLH